MLYITILLNYSLGSTKPMFDLQWSGVGNWGRFSAQLYPAQSLQTSHLKTILKDFRKCIYIYVCLYILYILLLLH